MYGTLIKNGRGRGEWARWGGWGIEDKRIFKFCKRFKINAQT